MKTQSMRGSPYIGEFEIRIRVGLEWDLSGTRVGLEWD
jgi:hypothetical protein